MSLIYQWSNLSVSITGEVQGLVQQVSVTTDVGLDFDTLEKATSSKVIQKYATAEIEITYLHNGMFIHPSGMPLHSEFGDIILHRFMSDVGSPDLKFNKCILVGGSTSIDADGYLGSSTSKFMACGGYEKVDNFASPAETTGNANLQSRLCYTGYIENQSAFSSDFSINRNFIFNPGSASPSYVSTTYPIITNSSVTVIVSSGVAGSQSAFETSSCFQEDTPASFVSQLIPGSYNIGFNLEGGGVDGAPQKMIHNYKSETDYGLARNVAIT